MFVSFTNRNLHPLWCYFGRQVSNGRDFFAMGVGELGLKGGKWGMWGREVRIEGAGSGDRVPPCPPEQCLFVKFINLEFKTPYWIM